MKIIKKGKSPKKETKVKCHKCKTVFVYEEKDIQVDTRDGNFVVCPNKECGAFISAES